MGKFKRNVAALGAVVMVAFCANVRAQSAGERAPFALGVYGVGEFPLGEYADYVSGAAGGGVVAEYTLPFPVLGFECGLSLHAQGEALFINDARFSSGWSAAGTGGFWLRFPLGTGGFFIQPEFSYGARLEGIATSEGMTAIPRNVYAEQLFAASASFRYASPKWCGGALEIALTPMYEIVPAEESAVQFMGVRAGALWRIKGKKAGSTKSGSVAQAEQQIASLNIENVTVKESDAGLILSLDNIQFKAGSAELAESEKTKLDKVAEILRQYDNDLLITGHCADDGSDADNMLISTSRAGAVADYLISRKVRDANHVTVMGKGSSQPIVSNDTEEGRAKNRRVEIMLVANKK